MKNAATIIFLTIFCSTVLSIGTVTAQHDHGSHGGAGHAEMDRPPHDGTLKEAGKYRIEMAVNMLVMQDKLTFYLFKGKLKPVPNEGITGTVSFQKKDGTSTTQDLRAYGDDGFSAQLEDTHSFNCTVTFEIKGKTVSTYFTHKGLGHGASAVYSCSMHPDIQSDSPGSCPKCGMFLEKQ